jgi:non-specific serine/threonine protein kinase
VTIAQGALNALDARAKAEYKQRIRDLERDVDEARAAHDLERTSDAERELEVLKQELVAAVGLGGKDRAQRSDAERARANITQRIRGVIKRIGAYDEQIGRHLQVAVKTGIFCSYSPPP